MIKSKRLKNLKLLKQKKLNKLTIEINTLNSEIKKSDRLKKKLEKIKNKYVKRRKSLPVKDLAQKLITKTRKLLSAKDLRTI